MIQYVKLFSSSLILIFLGCGKNNPSGAPPEIVGSDITIIRKTSDIPKACTFAFTNATGEQRFEMANPGDRYQGTDVIREHGLPWRRLIFAAVRNSRCAIDYEKGGIGKSTYFIVFDLARDPAEFVWGGPGIGQYDISSLRAAIAQSEKDAHGFPHHYSW